MVVHMSPRLLVDEEHVNRAVRIVEDVLQSHGASAEIEVTLDADPEDPAGQEWNVIAARLRDRLDEAVLLELIPEVGRRLEEARLIAPEHPLMFDIVPEW